MCRFWSVKEHMYILYMCVWIYKMVEFWLHWLYRGQNFTHKLIIIVNTSKSIIELLTKRPPEQRKSKSRELFPCKKDSKVGLAMAISQSVSYWEEQLYLVACMNESPFHLSQGQSILFLKCHNQWYWSTLPNGVALESILAWVIATSLAIHAQLGCLANACQLHLIALRPAVWEKGKLTE